MRLLCAITLLGGLVACTDYQPVAWNGAGSWAEARATAARAARSRAEARPRQAVLTAAVAARAPAPGTHHRVRPGETLSAIAARHGVALGALARANDIAAPFALRAGQVLALPARAPGGPRAPAVPVAAPSSRALPPAVVAVAELAPQGTAAAGAMTPALSRADAEATRRAAARTPPALSGKGFLWPAEGEVASGFGDKPNGARNNGIDIAALEGSPVLAAENGIVVFAGDGIAGYGNMLLISHAGGFMTAYAHNRDLLVRVGDAVARGQQVATVGTTGGVGAPRLHFELREGKKPLDPMAHLGDAPTRVASTR